jgi:transposase
MKFKRIAVDTSKSVFALHGTDAQDRAVLRRTLKRPQFEAFFAALEPTEVVLEACGGSHHWARRLGAMGHTVRLIPPQYVKPFVKRGKNDRIDAEAISEAAGRPGMRFVAVKSAAQQAEAMVLRVRALLVKQRTQLVNALRGHAGEFGIVTGRGMDKIDALLARIAADEAIPQAGREALALLGEEIARLDARIEAIDRELMQAHKATPLSRLLAGVPGIGPLGAITLVRTVDPAQFASARHFAAWLGLTPKEKSTGGRQRMGGISREGNERLRQLLVLGATAIVRVAVRKPEAASVSPWLRKLLERKPRKLAACALANKMARIAWAMMASGQAYRTPIPA